MGSFSLPCFLSICATFSAMPQVYCGRQAVAPVEAIIFDKDGTLADSRQFLAQLAQRRAQACAAAVRPFLGSPGQGLEDELLAIFGLTPAGLNPDGLMAAETRQANQQASVDCLVRAGYGADLSPLLVAEVFAEVDAQFAHKAKYTPPFASTDRLLRRLRQSPIKVGLLSSDSPAHVEDFLTHYQLSDWFDDWQGTAANDIPKPEPALLHQLCDRLQVDVSHTVVVGDSWVDFKLVQIAGAAAFFSVSEAWGRAPVAGASLILRSWDDLTVEAANSPNG